VTEPRVVPAGGLGGIDVPLIEEYARPVGSVGLRRERIVGATGD
jgi:hypothetical protein